MSEVMLIQHGAPTLAGIKTGSLFSCPYQERAQLLCTLRALNRRLVPKGLRLLPLRFADHRVLLYIYRPAELAADLSTAAARALLREAGYPDRPGERCLPQLIRRLAGGTEFPHEIGLFLSYPPEDVRGFIEHRAGGYKCAGCWKVYGDAQQAERTFERYRRCTACYLSQWSKGVAIERLAVAG